MRYEADTYFPNKSPYQYGLNATQDNGVTEVSLWLPWQLNFDSSEVRG